MRYTIRVIHEPRHRQSHLRLNPEDAIALGLAYRRQGVLSFGKRQEEVLIYSLPRIPSGVIEVGGLAANALMIKTEPSYEIRVHGERIILGPMIGMMMRHTEDELITELDIVLPYLNNYPQVGGCVYLFPADGVDWTAGEIDGYLYHPSLPGRLRKERFPFPSVWYRRVGFHSDQDFRRCRQVMGHQMINGYYFTKWEFWSWLQDVPEAREHIAFSSEVLSAANLDAFLNRFGSAYIKPVMAHSGYGIERVSRDGDMYVFERNYLDTLRLGSEELEAQMSQYEGHILQQPLHLRRYEGRQVTFRAITQRDGQGYWKLTGLVGFFGGVGGITGNWSRNGGFLKPGHEALHMMYDGDTRRAFRMREEVADVCVRMAHIIGREIDAYLDFGMDIGIDEDDHVWVIEANKRQHYETCEHVGDHQLHLASMANSLSACRHLAMR